LTDSENINSFDNDVEMVFKELNGVPFSQNLAKDNFHDYKKFVDNYIDKNFHKLGGFFKTI